MRQQARHWHKTHPEFAIDALKSLGRCKEEDEVRRAMHFHAEGLSIGFWTKKDVVQYPLACLHAQGSLVSVPSFCRFLDQFDESSENILQQLIEVAPVHYWTYLQNKTAEQRVQS